jgi:hypothetical protein
VLSADAWRNSGFEMAIYRRPGPQSPLQRLFRLVTFDLPRFNSCSKPIILELRRARGASPNSTPVNGDFCSDGAAALISLSVRCSTLPMQINLCFSSQALLSYCLVSLSPPRIVPWEEWGPSHVHFINLFSHHYIPHHQRTCGLRTFGPVQPILGPDGTLTLEVCDYHPGRVGAARALAERIPQEERDWTVCVGGTLDGSMARDGRPIETYVPYLFSRKVLPHAVPADSGDILSRWKSKIISILEDGVALQIVSVPSAVLTTHFHSFFSEAPQRLCVHDLELELSLWRILSNVISVLSYSAGALLLYSAASNDGLRLRAV